MQTKTSTRKEEGKIRRLYVHKVPNAINSPDIWVPNFLLAQRCCLAKDMHSSSGMNAGYKTAR